MSSTWRWLAEHQFHWKPPGKPKSFHLLFELRCGYFSATSSSRQAHLYFCWWVVRALSNEIGYSLMNSFLVLIFLTIKKSKSNLNNNTSNTTTHLPPTANQCCYYTVLFHAFLNKVMKLKAYTIHHLGGHLYPTSLLKNCHLEHSDVLHAWLLVLTQSWINILVISQKHN